MTKFLFASTSAVLKNNIFTQEIVSNMNNIIAIIASAFFGGLFAGFWSNHFESRRRLNEKRSDKYFDHRNTLVQLEQELIPARVNLSRNISSLKEAIENTNDKNFRLILRFYKFNLSTGLGLKLLNLDFINLYSEIYILIESINSDFQYIDGIINAVREDSKKERYDISLLQMYFSMIEYLLKKCEETDKKTLLLLSMIKIAIKEKFDLKKDRYVQNGGLINYNFSNKKIEKENKKTEVEEKIPFKDGEARPQFIAPYLDIKLVAR